MKKIIMKNPLFKGLSEEKIEEFLENSRVFKRKYKKDESIYLEGDIINKTGIVLSGRVCIESYDDNGNKHIFESISEAGHFGDSYAITSLPLMVSVRADMDTEILFINAKSLLSPDISGNLAAILAKKNMALSRKIRTVSRKTIRKKLMFYLREEAILKCSKKFKIPYDRQSLSDYLNCDRSQLSKELSKMKEEGLIKFYKNNFEILF